ncbi:myosin heavy chain, clone 203-like [Mytilus edulis]|uniref:myosin heavy chain, clone 203-like n=1 Tax=Mytilus edulis TaxID=6550 RepID=UPI0039EF3FB1
MSSENAEKEELRHELRNIKKGATETFNKNEKLREEKSKIFKQLCILQDSVTQTTDQSQDRFHQTIKLTDEKPISKVFDVIQTNVSYLNENILRLQDEIRSKEKTVKTQGEQINELQQQSFQSEIEKRKISEKLEIVCKEKEDLRKLRVLGNNISLEEERITEQEKTYNKNIIDLQQKTQQLEAEKDILLDKYKGVCKERDGFKDGSIFKDEIRAKEEVITKHDDTMEELEKRLQQLGTEKDSMLASYEKVCKEKEELINRSILTEKKLLKEKTAIERALDEKIQDLQQELQQLKLEKDSCLKKYVNVCKEKEDLIEGSKSIQLSFEEYEGRIENLERSLKEKEKELHNKSQEYLHQLNGKDSCILELNKVGNRHMANISDKEKTITFLQGEKDHLQTRQQGLINQLNQKDKTVLEINRMLNHQKKIISDKDETIRVMKKEKDDLQTRLSSVAGEKLTKGNPSITDLGDPNRPMKIGEKYGELYDNEWTDAMEHIIEVKKSYPDMKESEIEEIIIRHLHRLLKCCYKECKMKAEEQIHKLGESLAETMCFTFKSKDEIASLPVCKEALVLRRAKSEEFAKVLFQNQGLCKNIVADWDYINKNENVMQILTQSTFFEKCVYLCWCMVIQDPVMFLDDDPVPFSPIDKNTYKEFVKSGDSVAYVVWPALFLHNGGPLLYKGVVQAYWKKDEDDNMEGTRV